MSLANGDPLIRGSNISKRFGDFVAVDDIDFHVEPGEAFGFLGPNGAGKTSTMRMVGCVSQPTSGELRILGMDPAVDGSRIRARLGVVPQEDSLDTELTVLDNLLIYGRYFDLPRAEIRRRGEELLEFMQLTERRNDLVDLLSGGMKRRLTIGRALINQPDLILLDEPTTGLDPQARHLLWDRFYQLKRAGRTIVLTTHYMEEAEQLCDRLIIMDGGRIVTEGSPRELVARHATREVVELRFSTPEERDRALPRLSAFGERIEALTDRVIVYTHDAGKVVALVTDGELHPESVYERRGTLEDVFLILTGRTLDDDVATPTALRIVEKEFIAWKRLWKASVFQATISPLLFLAAMGLGLGDLVNKGSGGVDGVDYLVFVTPGLMAASAMMQGAGESLWPVLGGVKWMRTYHAAVSTPVSAGALFAGHVTWTCLRVLLSATVFLIVAAILGGVLSWWGVLAIPAAVLGASVFAAWLNGYAVTQDSDIPFAVIMRIGLFPLFLFSGTFFPTSRLPDWLEPVSWFSPLWHAVELCRAATTGLAPSAGSIAGHIAFLVVCLVGGCWWGVRRFEQALTT